MTNRKKNLTKIVLDEQDNMRQFVRRKISDISDMDAEDIVADVVFNIYNKIDIEYQIENILAYAYRSVRNKIVDYLRQKKVALSLDKPDKSSGMSLSEIIPDSSADIEKKIYQEEFYEKLYAALSELDPKHRAIWVATEIEDYSFKELAVQWKEPIGTLLSRKSRATQILKTKLKETL